MPDPTPDLAETIRQAAADPASASAPDGRSATARAIGELIDADRYLAGKAALKSRPGRRGSAWGAVRQVQASPPGAP